MTDVTTWDVPVAEATSEREPPKPATGPVLIGDILTSYGGRPALLHLWDDWARQTHEKT